MAERRENKQTKLFIGLDILMRLKSLELMFLLDHMIIVFKVLRKGKTRSSMDLEVNLFPTELQQNF